MKTKDATQPGAADNAQQETEAQTASRPSSRQDRMAAVIAKHTSGEGATEEASTHEAWRGEQAGAVAPKEGDGEETPDGKDNGGEPRAPDTGEQPDNQIPENPEADGAPLGETPDGDDPSGTSTGEHQDDPDPNAPRPITYKGLEGLPLYQMPDGEVKVKMRVHGQDVYEPIERLNRSAQKATAGDIALQEAAKARQDLEQWEKTLAQKEAELSASRQPSPDAVDETALAEEAKALVEELTLGDSDEAAVKLASFVQKNVARAAQGGSTVDPAAIVEQAKASLRADSEAQSRQQDINTGFRRVADKYPDLVTDDRAFKLLDDEAERLEAVYRGDPEWTPSRIMEEAADTIAEYLGRTPKTDPPPVPTADTAGKTSQREARKEGLRPIPRAGAAVSQSTREEPVDNTPKSVVDRMREQRSRLAGRQR